MAVGGPLDHDPTPAIDLAALASQFDLAGQTAVVPGGHGAIGEAICWALAAHGAKVAVAGPNGAKARRLAGNGGVLTRRVVFEAEGGSAAHSAIRNP
jgi:NAD(P)-dependent dehydrogenase (short-subunit alcohol dehydrogenase family)